MWSFAPHGPLAIFWNLLLTRHATCRLDRCVSAEWNESFGFAYKGTDKLRLHVTCLDRDNGSTDDFMCKVRKSPVQKPSLAHPSIPGILLRVQASAESLLVRFCFPQVHVSPEDIPQLHQTTERWYILQGEAVHGSTAETAAELPEDARPRHSESISLEDFDWAPFPICAGTSTSTHRNERRMMGPSRFRPRKISAPGNGGCSA